MKLKKSKFKVVFVLTQTPGVNWYRNACYLKKFDIEAVCWPKFYPDKLPNWEEAVMQNSKLLYDLEAEVKDCNVIVFQRVSSRIGMAVIQGFKSKHQKKTLIEIDDDVFGVDSSNPGFATVAPGKPAYEWFKHQLEFSDGAIVSTETLFDKYSKYNKNVFLVKNSIDFKMWDKLKPAPQNKKIRIGWQGSAHHYEDLDILKDFLPKIFEKYKKKIEVHIFGDVPDYLANLDIIKHDVVPINMYPQTLKNLNFDIALAPLHDSEFNRAKSNLRVIEYGALKKAVVASGNKNLPYASVIKHGENGFLAETKEEWVECVSKLIESKELREEFGSNLYKDVKKNYNLKDWAETYENILLSC